MQEPEDGKRLFFGAAIQAAWPKELPEGRVLDESERHMTLAFLGNSSFSAVQKQLSSMPQPNFRVGIVGKVDHLLFLPKHHPHVVAGDVEWLNRKGEVESFQKDLASWLKKQGHQIDDRPFLPHVTIARSPFSIHAWKELRAEIPLFVSGIHLYESVGNLTYRSLWSYPLVPPFEEFEHTADIAFRIRGETPQEVHLHAQMALAFKFPPLLPYISSDLLQNSLDDIIISLNALVARADEEIGTPFKAVSFHGKIKPTDTHILEWEMIVDV